MNKEDVAAKLEQDHQQITRGLARLMDFEKASDDALVRDEWDALEARVLAHLDAEEMFLLPGFRRDRPEDAAAVLDQHAVIRRLLGEMGIAVDLHLLQSEKLAEFRDVLASHVDSERQSLYVWASTSANQSLLRGLLDRIEGRSTPDAASLALANVLKACEDGEKGYSAAATDVSDGGYRLMFRHYAEERARFVRALDGASRKLGVVAAGGDGSTLGALHRNWLNVKAAIAGGNPKAVLVECRRGEEAALRAYRSALRADLPPDARELVQEQYESIKRARSEIAALVDARGS